MTSRRTGRSTSVQDAAAAVIAKELARHRERVRDALAAVVTRRLEAVARRFDQAGTRLPRLHWTAFTKDHRVTEIDGLIKSDHPQNEVPAVLAAWRSALQLEPASVLRRGTVEARGRYNEIPILVWGIADKRAWEAHARTLCGDTPEERSS